MLPAIESQRGVEAAVTPPLRATGVVNGLFHEDGTVWSLNDVRAIKAMSGYSPFTGQEHQMLQNGEASRSYR